MLKKAGKVASCTIRDMVSRGASHSVVSLDRRSWHVSVIPQLILELQDFALHNTPLISFHLHLNWKLLPKN
jgi:hypothetical protein